MASETVEGASITSLLARLKQISIELWSIYTSILIVTLTYQIPGDPCYRHLTKFTVWIFFASLSLQNRLEMGQTRERNDSCQFPGLVSNSWQGRVSLSKAIPLFFFKLLAFLCKTKNFLYFKLQRFQPCDREGLGTVKPHARTPQVPPGKTFSNMGLQNAISCIWT